MSNTKSVSAVATSAPLHGFRGSDWDNAGENLYALQGETGEQKIYRSRDRGKTFEKWLDLPTQVDNNGYYGFATTLFIPTQFNNEPETMFVAPLGNQELRECKNINAPYPEFTTVQLPPGFISDHQTGGVLDGFAEDNDGNIYVGWYSFLATSPEQASAFLFKRVRETNTWVLLKQWDARHIHTVRFNPYNRYLYVVLGEPYNLTNGSDAAKVMRLKPDSVEWTCVADTWNKPPYVWEPKQLYLYFASIGFLKNRVFLGEDTDYMHGRIFSFDDDGREGKDVAFKPEQMYEPTGAGGAFFLSTARVGARLYFASQFLAQPLPRPPPVSAYTRCVSTIDGVEWREECNPVLLDDKNFAPNLGTFTYHPERGGNLIYCLSKTEDSRSVELPSVVIFYNKNGANNQPYETGMLDPAGNYTDVQSNSFSPPTPWSQVVVTRNGFVFFYCATTSQAWIGRLSGDGTYSDQGPIVTVADGPWTQIVSTKNGSLLFYQSDPTDTTAGWYSTGVIDPNGRYTPVTPKTKCWSWSLVVGTKGGGILWYRSDGTAATGYLDSGGNYADVSLVKELGAGWTQAVGANSGSLLLYRDDKTYITALLDATTHHCTSVSQPSVLEDKWDQIVGTSNGRLLFYSSDGKMFTGGYLNESGQYINDGLQRIVPVNSGWTNIAGR